MSKRASVWCDEDVLSVTIRQIAINNGTPNVMPTLEQMGQAPGLVSWIKRSGGVKKISTSLNMIMKPNVVPIANEQTFKHRVLRGAMVLVHTKSNVYSAIVLEKSKEPGGLLVLVLNKKLARKHVRYGVIPSSQYQWCYTKDLPQERVILT